MIIDSRRGRSVWDRPTSLALGDSQSHSRKSDPAASPPKPSFVLPRAASAPMFLGLSVPWGCFSAPCSWLGAAECRGPLFLWLVHWPAGRALQLEPWSSSGSPNPKLVVAPLLSPLPWARGLHKEIQNHSSCSYGTLGGLSSPKLPPSCSAHHSGDSSFTGLASLPAGAPLPTAPPNLPFWSHPIMRASTHPSWFPRAPGPQDTRGKPSHQRPPPDFSAGARVKIVFNKHCCSWGI